MESDETLEILKFLNFDLGFREFNHERNQFKEEKKEIESIIDKAESKILENKTENEIVINDFSKMKTKLDRKTAKILDGDTYSQF